MLIIVHLSLMIAAALSFIAGIGMAMFGRKKNTWLKWHKHFNTAGVCLLAAGAVTAFVNVVTSAGRHLAGPHQWLGLAAIILCGFTFFLGFYVFKAADKAAVRKAHRLSGRLAGLAVLSALSLGLIMIGLL